MPPQSGEGLYASLPFGCRLRLRRSHCSLIYSSTLAHSYTFSSLFFPSLTIEMYFLRVLTLVVMDIGLTNYDRVKPLRESRVSSRRSEDRARRIDVETRGMRVYASICAPPISATISPLLDMIPRGCTRSIRHTLCHRCICRTIQSME